MNAINRSIRFPDATVAPSAMLLLALFTSYLLPAELYTVVLLVLFFGYAVSSPGHITQLAFKLAFPFMLLGILGFAMAVDNDRYLALKDGWYILKLCLCLMVGLMLGVREHRPENLFRVLVIFGVATGVCVILVMPVIHAGGLGSAEAEGSNLLPLASLAALPILLDRVRAKGAAFLWRDLAALLLLLAAAAISNSRITLIASIIMLLSWAGLFANAKRTIIGGLAVAAVGALLWQFLPEYTGGELNALTKLRRSLDEMLPDNVYDSQTMLLNWRGFEAFNAQLMFDQGSTVRKLLGFGLGAEINLGQVVRMSQEMAYQYLPTIHNGFYFVLIKFGMVGIVIYGLAVASWLRWGRGRHTDGRSLTDRILRGQVVIVFASTAVITGLFNKSELHGVTVLVAFIIGMGCRMLSDHLKAAEEQQHLASTPVLDWTRA